MHHNEKEEIGKILRMHPIRLSQHAAKSCRSGARIYTPDLV